MERVAIILVVLLLASIFIMFLARLYIKRIKPYEKFPNYPQGLYWMLKLVIRSFSSPLPLTTVSFQMILEQASLFQKEGFCMLWVAHPHMIVYSPDAIKFFVTHQDVLVKPKSYEFLKQQLGTGLLTINDGEVWAQHRKVLNSAFHRKIYTDNVSVFNTNSLRVIQKIKNEMHKPWISVETAVERYTFDTLCDAVIGLKDSSVGNSIEEMFKVMESIMEFILCRSFCLWLRYDFLLPLFSGGRRYLHTINTVQPIIKSFVSKVLETKENTGQISAELQLPTRKNKSVLESLVVAYQKDKIFSLEDIEFEIKTMLAAGFDTSSMGIMWTIYLLGLHPDVQEKAFGEICSLTNKEVSIEDLSTLRYLDSIIKETLRLYPPIPVIAKRLTEDIQFDKYTIVKDTEIVFLLYSLHRNPECFPDPEKFDPDRFFQGNTNSINAFAYMPFSKGQRNCIGQSFSVIEMKIFLIHLLRNFKITSLDPRDKITIKWNLFLKPLEPLKIKFTPREA